MTALAAVADDAERRLASARVHLRLAAPSSPERRRWHEHATALADISDAADAADELVARFPFGTETMARILAAGLRRLLRVI